jgi:hypothetical protein
MDSSILQFYMPDRTLYTDASERLYNLVFASMTQWFCDKFVCKALENE